MSRVRGPRRLAMPAVDRSASATLNATPRAGAMCFLLFTSASVAGTYHSPAPHGPR